MMSHKKATRPLWEKGSSTMVGQLPWLVTLGRFNLHAHVATMSRFRAAPRQGHMERLRRIYAYAIRTKDYAVRFRTDQLTSPSYQNKILIGLTLYMGMSMKSFPDDMPEPLGKTVVIIATMDANLNHCLATSKSLTGWLHFVNKTPVYWYSMLEAPKSLF